MSLPLYMGLESSLPGEGAMLNRHWGLMFDRLYNDYTADFSKSSRKDEGKSSESKSWIRKFHERHVGDKEQLKAKAESLRAMVHSLQGQAKIMVCNGMFTTGLGNPHPLENGFTWHPTLGTPYLPGSTVKGLVRSVIETSYEGGDRDALLQRWFGTADKKDVSETSGQFTFMDALPMAPCQLYVAIMTPHMGKWCEKGGKSPLTEAAMPGDWHSPVPVQYLTARKLQLQFAIVPRTAHAMEELDDVWQALTHGLQYLGAGAKTAIGHGQFEEDAKAESALAAKLQERLQAQAHQARLEGASPTDRLLLELETEMPVGLSKLGGGHQDLQRAFTWLEIKVAALTEATDLNPEQRTKAEALIRQGFKAGSGWSGALEKRVKAAIRAIKGE